MSVSANEIAAEQFIRGLPILKLRAQIVTYVSAARAVHNEGLYLLVSTAISNRCTYPRLTDLNSTQQFRTACLPTTTVHFDVGDRTGYLSVPVV